MLKCLLICVALLSIHVVSGSNKGTFSPENKGENERIDSSSQELSPRFAVKTNLLYDAVLFPSVEGEYYFARRWSANLDFQMAWWKLPSKDYYYQLAVVSPELRYWLKGQSAFRGHFASLYVLGGIYDLKFSEREGFQSDELWSAGIGWGYYFPLPHKFALEFALSAGYLSTRYEKYRLSPTDIHHYIYDGTSRFSYFGPTKAKICLVWRF